MEDSERLKAYSALAETTRKWVSVMDTKAGFISALNAGLLAFIWTGAKVVDAGGWPKYLALAATSFSLSSLQAALWIVLSRASLKRVFGRRIIYAEGFKPISFYGFVVECYPKGHDGRFIADVLDLDAAALMREALEQHFTISHVVQQKSNWVVAAGFLLLTALVLTGIALFVKVLG